MPCIDVCTYPCHTKPTPCKLCVHIPLSHQVYACTVVCSNALSHQAHALFSHLCEKSPSHQAYALYSNVCKAPVTPSLCLILLQSKHIQHMTEGAENGAIRDGTPKSCGCPKRAPSPPLPQALPFCPSPCEKLQSYLVDYYKARTFKSCHVFNVLAL